MNEREIFAAAMERVSEAERAAFLDGACGGDAALRGRIEALLKEQSELGSFLESPHAALAGAVADVTAEAPSERPGTVIGPYKLLEPIGEGGMGSVYMAEQTAPVRRKVALKVIKAGMDSRQVLARFDAERQALALMDHPNIAKVLDAGATEQSRPYFVMELVKGVPITQFCDQRRLTPRERLELFIPICQAVQHAHQKGVIHRDLKPSNVMVALYDGEPVPKVIDFGVAKATGQKLTEATLFTGFGAVVGTPEYMSPEQAELNQLDIDTRSDIYSLGVLLYELLTGSTPIDRRRFREAALLEILRVIREEDPQRPSARLSTTEELPSIAANRNVEPRKLTGLVRGELDWIVMKALEKDRNRRYETANGLAADLRRYLDDEPVQACPPSAGYRLRKLARRNKGLLLTGAIVLLALIVGTAVATWQAVRARDAERLAEQRLTSETAARKAADQTRRKAEENLDRARDAVNECFDVVTSDPALQEPGLEEVRKVLLQKALRYYQEFLRQRRGDPTMREDVARTHQRVGFIEELIGEVGPATLAYEQARDLFRGLAGDPVQPADRGHAVSLARCFEALGRLYQQAGRAGDSEGAFRSAREGWDALIRIEPGVAEHRRELATVYFGLARLVLSRASDHDAALDHIGRAIALLEGLVADAPEDRRLTLALVSALTERSNARSAVGHHADIRTDLVKGIRLLERLDAEQSDDPTLLEALATAYNELGRYYFEHSSWIPPAEYREISPITGADANERTENGYLRSIALRERLVREHPRIAKYRFNLSATCNNLALYYSLTTPEKAPPYYRRVIELRERLVRDHPEVPRYRARLGKVYQDMGLLARRLGRLSEAEDALRSAVRILDPLAAAEVADLQASLDRASAHHNLGLVLEACGKTPAALASYDEAIRCLDDILAREPRHLAAIANRYQTRSSRAAALTALGQFEEALKEWDRAQVDIQSTGNRLQYHVGRARTLAASGRLDGASSEARSISEPPIEASGRPAWHSARIFAHLARVVREDRRLPLPEREDAAEGYLRRARALLEEALRDRAFADNPARMRDVATTQEFVAIRGDSRVNEILNRFGHPVEMPNGEEAFTH